MSWFRTVHTAFEAEGWPDLADEFLTSIEAPDAFDEDPTFKQLVKLCEWLEWDLVDLMCWHVLTNGLTPAKGRALNVEASK